MHHGLLHLGPVTFPVFGLVAAVGLVCALLLAERNARVLDIDREAVWNVCLTAIVGTLVISRVALILQSPRAFVGYPLLVLTLPTVTRFGFAAAVLCGLGYAKYRRLPLLTTADALAPAVMLLFAFTHLGDFFAGEDIGVATMNPLGRIVPSLRGTGALSNIGSWPVALYASLLSVTVCVVGVLLLGRTSRRGEVLGATLVLGAAARFLLDLVRFHGFDAEPWSGLYRSQWLLLMVVVVGGVLMMQRRNAKMPSKNMLPKGKRRQTVRPLYRAQRTIDQDLAAEAAAREEALLPIDAQVSAESAEIAEAEIEVEGATRSLTADDSAKGVRLDAYLAKAVPDVSRARVQMLIEQEKVRVNGKVEKAKLKLMGGERIEIEGEAKQSPMRARAENIPLEIVFEDADMAVVNKPAGMQVHAGAGDEERNRGTLVNALLYHFQQALSGVGGELRPGIVHRLDKETSGLIMVAKNDKAHRALAQMFEEHTLEKKYIALVHGEIGRRARGNAERDRGTINLPIARDPVRRIRMTTRIRESYMTIDSPGSAALRHPEQEELKPAKNYEARSAVSHYEVIERLSTSVGEFTLVEVIIETGRTHQIRVHMQALGHPVVGDTLYGAPARIPGLHQGAADVPTLSRNFLHAASLRFDHPVTHEPMHLEAPLPPELTALLERLRKLRGR